VGVNNSLPGIGKWNYREGEKLYEKGLLVKAKAKYEQAAKIDPNNSEFEIALGKIDESLGELKEASTHYKKALKQSNSSLKESNSSLNQSTSRALNNLGRVNISLLNHDLTAEALLRMGVEKVPQDNLPLKYELYQNLGWVLSKQKQYPEAEKKLQVAVAIYEVIQEKPLGGGMAYCLLEDVLEDKKDKKDKKKQSYFRKMCFAHARPETIEQYKWLLETRKEDRAKDIKTTGVVNTESNSSNQP
jgi:tetratricopeptide (TPR) repeat protein